MKTCSVPGARLMLLVFMAYCCANPDLFAQKVIGLDNWFNHEISQKTGESFHYLWTDTERSGFSIWGDLFISKGARITTLEKPLTSVLKNIDVYIIADPDTTTESVSPNYLLPGDIKAIKKWVKAGGVLVILANDAPNCEFTHLNTLASQFGITFNHVTIHPVSGNDFEQGAITNLPDYSIFKGVKKIFMKDISDMNLTGSAKALLKENGKVLIAENCWRKGYVFAVGDPWIYNEYIDHDRLPDSFENRKAAENLTDLLLRHANER